MKWLLPWLLMSFAATADECRVLIAGTGCRTRQLAIQRILEAMPEVKEVTILSREQAPAENQRYFVVRSAGKTPSKEEMVAALGRRAKFYQIVSVTPVDEGGR